MADFRVEFHCSHHGFERFRIKVVKKVNIPSGIIVPKYRSRPRPGSLSCLVVGIHVDDEEVRKYLVEYLKRKGMWEKVLSLKLTK